MNSFVVRNIRITLKLSFNELRGCLLPSWNKPQCASSLQKPRRAFSWFRSGNKVPVNSARRQKDLFSPLRSAIIWEVEEHTLKSRPGELCRGSNVITPTTQHGSSKRPALPPVPDAARHHLASASSCSFQAFVFGSVGLGYALGALKHLGNRWIGFFFPLFLLITWHLWQERKYSESAWCQ